MEPPASSGPGQEAPRNREGFWATCQHQAGEEFVRAFVYPTLVALLIGVGTALGASAVWTIRALNESRVQDAAFKERLNAAEEEAKAAGDAARALEAELRRRLERLEEGIMSGQTSPPSTRAGE